MTGNVTLSELEPSPNVVASLQRVFEGAPDYFLSVTGQTAAADEAKVLWSRAPMGTSPNDRRVYGIFEDNHLVGCADVLRDFPSSGVAFIGLLLVTEERQRQGIGRAAYHELEKVIEAWSCSSIRLAIVRTNNQAAHFWESVGFTSTEESKPYHHGSVVSEAIIYSKRCGQA